MKGLHPSGKRDSWQGGVGKGFVPPGFQNPDPLHTKKCNFSTLPLKPIADSLFLQISSYLESTTDSFFDLAILNPLVKVAQFACIYYWLSRTPRYDSILFVLSMILIMYIVHLDKLVKRMLASVTCP